VDGAVPRAVGQAVQPAPTPVVVSLGETVGFELDYQPVAIICDDPSILRIEAEDGTIRMTAIKPGRTECNFRKPASIPSPVFSIRVLPP
jgi:hypothetical protein